MGVMYVGGEGVVKDYVRAYIGFDLAASAGAAPAGKARDQFSKILTPNQIAEAERMARERSEKHRKANSWSRGIRRPPFGLEEHYAKDHHVEIKHHPAAHPP